MVELHGWLTICKCYGDEDELTDDEHKSIQNNNQSDHLKNCGVTLSYKNGVAYLSVLHCSNHRTEEVDEIIGVFCDAAKAANGSYGIIYMRDDEDKEYFSEFQVFVFKNGECSKVRDKMLSPCIPVIEADIYNKNIQKEE